MNIKTPLIFLCVIFQQSQLDKSMTGKKRRSPNGQDHRATISSQVTSPRRTESGCLPKLRRMRQRVIRREKISSGSYAQESCAFHSPRALTAHPGRIGVLDDMREWEDFQMSRERERIQSGDKGRKEEKSVIKGEKKASCCYSWVAIRHARVMRLWVNSVHGRHFIGMDDGPTWKN